MDRKILQVSALFLILFAFPIATFSETAHFVYYVNINSGDDFNDGLSWNSAFKNLQPAIDVAVQGDTIKVAAGTYLPTEKMAEVYDEEAVIVLPTNDRHRSFLIQKEIHLYGGFPADATNATTHNDRDWIKNETILSGDFNGDDDGFKNMDENALHVVVLLFVTSATRLDGFIITGGNVSADSADVYVNNVLVQRNCGGGIYAISKYESSPTLANLVIRDNQAEQYGGGIYNYSESGNASPKLENVAILSNFADERGGGFFNDGMNASPELRNVNITGNLATFHGGGLFCIAEQMTAPYLENVLIAGNKATSGAGVYIIALEEDATPIITNATICHNKAAANGNGGGLFVSAYTALAKLEIRNTVIWGNRSNTVDNLIVYGESNPTSSWLETHISNSFIEGMIEDNELGYDNRDPMFFDPVDAELAPTVSGYGNYRLSPESPLIDQGNNAFVTLSKDLDGQTRIVGSAVDIGAYEYQGDNSGNKVLLQNEHIWSHQGKLYVKIINNNVTMHIYSVNGNLVRQVNKLGEGLYSYTLPCGLYIVTLSTGETTKIIIR